MTSENPDLADFTLLTSNDDKIKEFYRFGLSNLTFAKGQDIEEVDGTPDEVIVYKAIAAGAMCIVEDSVVLIDGEPVVDIRWKRTEMRAWVGKPIDFEVRLGVNDGVSIHVFKGMVSGRIVEPRGEGGFGFDPFLEVDGTGMTLAELESSGLKDANNPRLTAINQLLAWEADFSTELTAVPAWRGPMQGH
jgi:inosine/xanthosine triphosphate pyrophosphatase family protein